MINLNFQIAGMSKKLSKLFVAALCVSQLGSSLLQAQANGGRNNPRSNPLSGQWIPISSSTDGSVALYGLDKSKLGILVVNEGKDVLTYSMVRVGNYEYSQPCRWIDIYVSVDEDVLDGAIPRFRYQIHSCDRINGTPKTRLLLPVNPNLFSHNNPDRPYYKQPGDSKGPANIGENLKGNGRKSEKETNKDDEKKFKAIEMAASGDVGSIGH